MRGDKASAATAASNSSSRRSRRHDTAASSLAQRHAAAGAAASLLRQAQPRAAFERAAAYAWQCGACGRQSCDMRHVCAHCLAVEPGYAAAGRQEQQQHDDNVQQRQQQGRQGIHNDTSVVGDCGSDAGARLLTVAHTGRVYRIVTESIRGGHDDESSSNNMAAAAQDANTTRDDDDNEHVDDEDEPSCAVQTRVLTLDDIVRRANDVGVASDAAEAAAAAAAAAQSRRGRGGGAGRRPYTHFVSLPLGKMPAVTTSAERLLTALRTFVQCSNNNNKSTTMTAAGRQHASRLSDALVLRECARLHMTLLLLTLDTDEDVALAQQLLQQRFAPAWTQAKTRLLQQQQRQQQQQQLGDDDEQRCVRVRFGPGLHVMPDARTGRSNTAHARVVYMAPHDDDDKAHNNNNNNNNTTAATTGETTTAATALQSRAVLRELQHTLRTALREVVDDAQEAERLARIPHVTLLNVKWGDDAQQHNSSSGSSNMTTNATAAAAAATRGQHMTGTFDATALLSAFADACLGGGDDGGGAVPLTHIELCRRGDNDDPQAHGYAVECSVPL